MQRLFRLAENLERRNLVFQQNAESLFAVHAILREIEELKREIEKLDDKAGFLFTDKETIRARNALQRRVELLLRKLEEFSRNPERGKL
jgi:hypothetical protein